MQELQLDRESSIPVWEGLKLTEELSCEGELDRKGEAGEYGAQSSVSQQAAPLETR